jgi:hypothetical protein
VKPVAATSTKLPKKGANWRDPTLADSYAEYSYQYSYGSARDYSSVDQDFPTGELEDNAEEEEGERPVCLYGPWGAWDPCSRECGSGVTHRQRQLIDGPAEVCTHLTHKRSCFGRTCHAENSTQAVVKETATLLPGKFSSHR